MQLLYSNILPLGIEEDQKTIIDAFHEQLQLADRVEIWKQESGIRVQAPDF